MHDAHHRVHCSEDLSRPSWLLTCAVGSGVSTHGTEVSGFGSFASDVLRSHANHPSNLRQRYTPTYRTSVTCTPVFSSSEIVNAISVRVLLSYLCNT